MMADEDAPKDETAGAMVETTPVTEIPALAAADKPAPRKPGRKPGRKPAVKAVQAKPAAPAKVAAAKASPVKAAVAKSASAKAPAAKKISPAKPVAAKPTAPAASVKVAPKPSVSAKPKAAKPKAAPKAAPDNAPVFAGLFKNFMLEEQTMDMSANYSAFQDAMAEAQSKAKAAFEKGSTMMGDASEFTKGNVEAMIESGKIFAEGMQSFGSELVNETRSAFETMSGDVKELASAKSPTDFFKLQGDMMRKTFDSVVAHSSKNSEAMLKLASDAMAPLSGRVSMAMEKARSASL